MPMQRLVFAQVTAKMVLVLRTCTMTTGTVRRAEPEAVDTVNGSAHPEKVGDVMSCQRRSPVPSLEHVVLVHSLSRPRHAPKIHS